MPDFAAFNESIVEKPFDCEAYGKLIWLDSPQDAEGYILDHLLKHDVELQPVYDQYHIPNEILDIPTSYYS